ncbi:hypothetical protein OGAPHI_003177 [Ogataea philodendri]|uniref:Uncharacterized protein n=1 Tax=Ogataea philodendri TaxID=1378263 RepID=A0A9P8P8I6_9ASCO|nr:uncharacterized protein OGAPHI_003177 [Ogataea philodendri]KAH3667528.1 hypothetical protein OGAPHI_003177 [Ogataea philodendri]
MSQPSWSLFVNKVGMPNLVTSTHILDSIPITQIVIFECHSNTQVSLPVILPNHSHTREPIHLCGLRMLLNTAPITTELQLFDGRKLLVSEKNNNSFGHQQSKLIFLLITQVTQLQSNQLGSNVLG